MKKTRTIVHIDPDLCNGCGECVPSCAEGAIQIIDGKARLVAENLCDGLGACLGHCPMDAIWLEEREADDFDEEKVHEHLQQLGLNHPAGHGAHPAQHETGHGHGHGHGHAPEPAVWPACPGSAARDVRAKAAPPPTRPAGGGMCPGAAAQQVTETSQGLTSWPIQLGLVNPAAGFLKGGRLLIAADCTAFALPGFHTKLAGDRVTLIGCPKLDDAGAYVKKLAAIFKNSDIQDVTLAIMEVPCCGGLTQVVRMAQREAGTSVPVTTQVVTIDGEMEEAV